jgi:hypothetical protein
MSSGKRAKDVSAPLYNLTSKGVAFHWDTSCQAAFEHLKSELTSCMAPILSFPDFRPNAAPFHLQTDASAVGIGAVLEQDGHVIAFASRVLSSSERNYSVIQRECLAIVYALTANRITQELVQVFSRFGLPAILHSDQGANLKALFSAKPWNLLEFTNAYRARLNYHPQGDDMVERFNCTLLQMLRTYVHQQSEWEQHLPLVLFAYRSATHPSTGFSPFELMFGRLATLADFPRQSSFEPMSYQAELRNRLSEFRDLVDTHHTQAAHHQKLNYDRCTQSRTFTEGDPVWLSCPIAKKLEARWEGGWQITKVISSTTIEIKSTKGTKVVHSNRLRHRLQPDRSKNTQAEVVKVPWEPPTVSHETFLCDPPTSRYPQRDRRPPDRLQMPPN